MMNDMTLIRELRRISIDKHRCFGCGHEHNCGIHGCTIMKEAADWIEQLALGVKVPPVVIKAPVRCGGCRWSREASEGEVAFFGLPEGHLICTESMVNRDRRRPVEVPADHFCGYGKPKEAANEP